MEEKFDMNVAIERYVHASGNRMDLLEIYCDRVGYDGEVRRLGRMLDELQGAIWGKVLGTSGTRELTERRLGRIVREQVEQKRIVIAELGHAVLMNWVRSMADKSALAIQA